MPSHDPSALLQSLSKANWCVAARTYGSSHATLIGLLANWWITLSPSENSVLDGAPSHSHGNAGWCDLMLCANDLPLGVVEVEGTKPLDKLGTLDAYFSSSKASLSGIEFGLLLVYAYYAKGRGKIKRYAPAETPDVLSAAQGISAAHPSKALMLLALDKVVDESPSLVRSSSQYHVGSLKSITAVLLVAGDEVHREVLFEASSTIVGVQ